MTAAILAPGPSLASWTPATFASYGLRVGVNRAVTFCPCDWWVFGDDTLFASCRPAGQPRIFTNGESVRRIGRTIHGVRLFCHTVTTFEERIDRMPEQLGWPIFSATAAVAIAAMEGASRIDVYGADWTNAPDWDGVGLTTNRRGDERWGSERIIWQRLIDHLADKGVKVQRISAAV